MRKNIPVVVPEWLYMCSTKWIKLPKSDFGHHGLGLKHFRERHEAGHQCPKLSDLESLSKGEMKSMADDIDAELGESSSESEKDEEEKGSDTEGEAEEVNPMAVVSHADQKAAARISEEEEDQRANKRL